MIFLIFLYRFDKLKINFKKLKKLLFQYIFK
jgi:hypothetical protein